MNIIGESEIIVIGAGMTGLLTAYFLQETGKKVLVLEADTVASGQTGRTTAKITSQHGLFYDRLMKNIGYEKAALYAKANEEAIGAYEKLVMKLNIDCDFKRLPSYLYSMENAEILQKELKAAQRLGLPAKFVKQIDLPFETYGAVCFEHQAQFHPLKFVEAIAGKLEIREHTLVKTVKKIPENKIVASKVMANKITASKSATEKSSVRESAVKGNNQRNAVYTDKGIYLAEKVVFATHYPIVDFPGLYFLRQHQERSYVLALAGCKELQGMYYSADEGGLSLRSSGDILLLGGEKHRTGKKQAGGAYAALREAACRYFPEGSEVEHWSAQDCMPHDELPFIGQYFYGCRDWYVATGYKKWGMTTSMVAARLLTDMITGAENPYKSAFTPQRHHVRAAFLNFVKDAGESICGLTGGWVPGLRQETEVCYHLGQRENISLWERETRQEKAARQEKETRQEKAAWQEKAVRQENAIPQKHQKETVCDMVKTPRCAHLGCKLTWNPDEESWDCPCHGSRYDKNGKLLDEPACRNLILGK